MKPDVTAIVVNYNSGSLLKRAVDSLLRAPERVRIEVVDNASSDDSLAPLRRDPAYTDRVSITVNACNLGFAAANNRILEKGDSEYYLLINPDCVLEETAVGSFVAYMDRSPDVGLAGGTLLNPDGSVQRTSKRRFPTPWSSLGRTIGLHRFGFGSGAMSDFDLATEPGEDAEPAEAISGALMFVRGSALERVGLLDEGYFMHCEDLDWCKRFWDAGYKVAYVPTARAVHVKGGSGRGPKVIWHLHRGMLRFYAKHYRGRYPWLLTGLVYVAVYARCAILMAVSLVPRRA